MVNRLHDRAYDSNRLRSCLIHKCRSGHQPACQRPGDNACQEATVDDHASGGCQRARAFIRGHSQCGYDQEEEREGGSIRKVRAKDKSDNNGERDAREHGNGSPGALQADKLAGWQADKAEVLTCSSLTCYLSA